LIVGGGGQRQQSIPFAGSGISQIHPTVINNILYIGNMFALRQWYHHIRGRFVGRRFPDTLHKGLLHSIDRIIEERIKRFAAFCSIIAEMPSREDPGDGSGLELLRVRNIGEIADVLKAQQQTAGPTELRDRFLSGLEKEIARQGKDYVRVIQGLDRQMKKPGVRWLQGIIDQIASEMVSVFPQIKFEGASDG
jgi:UDP-N-acetylglucosamine/UDP-N-acetylgalactosamine diphosphorylase